jgi:hypothetical protein
MTERILAGKNNCFLAGKRGQVSVEYLVLTAFILIIVVIIFAFALFNYDSNVRLTKAGESLESIAKTADLVYAKGYGTMLSVKAQWPNGIKTISIIHKCRESVEMQGCPGGQDVQCPCTLGGSCTTDSDCIKYSALRLEMDDGIELLSASKTKLCIKSGSQCIVTPNAEEFPLAATNFEVNVSWFNIGGADYIALQPN